MDKYHEEMKEKFSKKSGRIQSEVTRMKVNEAVVVKEEPLEEYQDNQEDNENYFLDNNQADKPEENLTASMNDDFDEGEPMDLDEFIDNLCENEEDDDNTSDENEKESDKPSLSEEEEDEMGEDPSDDDDYTPINRTSRYRG